MHGGVSAYHGFCRFVSLLVYFPLGLFLRDKIEQEEELLLSSVSKIPFVYFDGISEKFFFSLFHS